MQNGGLQRALLIFTKKTLIINDAYKKSPDLYIACVAGARYLCVITSQSV
jgi:hypothetical protein